MMEPMDLPGANHVADFILATARLDSDTRFDQLQLNKLCYLVNGFTLREQDEPAFYNDVEAWRHGPVVPEVYQAYRRYGREPITELDMCRTSLDDRKNVAERWAELFPILGRKVATIAYGVVREYGRYSGWDLATMTHKRRTPWKRAYRPGRNRVIPTDDIMRFYRKLKSDDNRR
ncbi:MAG: DUF4065 domain-containing protein [Thaumarchaeota archaeon]|nr:DUF4065 domain-containing protein [Nitrososphaerota archaeon]